jgi:hypothetical protein
MQDRRQAPRGHCSSGHRTDRGSKGPAFQKLSKQTPKKDSVLIKSLHMAEVLFSWPLTGFSQIKLSKIDAFHLGMTELLH